MKRPLLPALLFFTGIPIHCGAITITAPNATSNPPSTTAVSPTAPELTPRKLPEIGGAISLPKEWTLLQGKPLDGGVLVATSEKIVTEDDPWTTGLSLTIDRNAAKESGQKARVYALSIAKEAREKAGEEASPIVESQSGPFHEIRFDFPVASEQPILVTEVLRANESTGTVTTIVWQMPREKSADLRTLRDTILSGISLDPKL